MNKIKGLGHSKAMIPKISNMLAGSPMKINSFQFRKILVRS